MVFSSRILSCSRLSRIFRILHTLVRPAILSALGASLFAMSALAATSPQLTVVDPYLLTIPKGNSLAASAVVSSAFSAKVTAAGIMADGTSAAIAVYKTTSAKNVTFLVSNGATVAAYTPAFLTSVAAPGAARVVVTPTKISGAYYALALVISGTAPDVEHGADTVVTAASAGGVGKKTFSLLTLPTPIVLIHGLWGDQTSLASPESYLQATVGFKPYKFLVTPICYSLYLNFDAAADTLPGHGTGCEMTSAQALDRYFSTTLYKQLDTDHYVGGRVDAVVHSMGGLVVRHYAKASHFKSVRNRMLGAFRNVVTLDTPETGSALATYLDDVAYNRTLKATNQLGNPYQIWTFICGSDPKTTLEACLDSNGFPLAYQGKPLSTGAVASLIPSSASLKAAPKPTIFNTSYGKWYAIASDWKDTDKPPSLIRAILDDLVAATYSPSQTAPTLSSILGTEDNDVIVTVASQTASAPSAQVVTFKDLGHTGLPGSVSIQPYSNNKVTAWPAVNAQVAKWLGLQASTTPAVAEWPGATRIEEPETNPQGPAGRIGALFAAPQRLSIQAPENAVGLAQPALIPLHLQGSRVTEISAEQFSPVTGQSLSNESTFGPVGSGHPRIVSQEGGEATIEVTPLALGPVSLRVTARFADGGFARQQVLLNVVPSQRSLSGFALHNGFHSLALVLTDRDEDREFSLSPVAEFETLRYPLHLASVAQLELTVDQPEDDPVIRVDSNGLVHALRPGAATITADFDGIQDSVTVDVYPPETAPAGYRRDHD